MFAHLMVIRRDSYPPTDDTETATLRGAMARYGLWRVSHAYHPRRCG